MEHSVHGHCITHSCTDSKTDTLAHTEACKHTKLLHSFCLIQWRRENDASSAQNKWHATQQYNVEEGPEPHLLPSQRNIFKNIEGNISLKRKQLKENNDYKGMKHFGMSIDAKII